MESPTLFTMPVGLDPGDPVTVVAGHRHCHGFARVSQDGVSFERLYPDGSRRLWPAWFLSAEVEGVEWLRGHLPSDDECIDAAIAAQALQRG